MSIRTTRDSARGFTEHVVIGIVTDEEMFACQTTFYQAGPTRLQLWDMSAADLTQITVDGMRRFVRRSAALGRERQGGRTAVVAPAPLQYGLGRMAEAFAEFESLPFGFRVFHKRDDAARWLETPDSQPADPGNGP